MAPSVRLFDRGESWSEPVNTSDAIAEPAARSPLAAGRTIGHYEILRKLGRGGMGQVFLARDTRLEREVVIKTLASPFTRDRARLERFQREAKAVAALTHPNIVTLYSDELEAGIYFLTMEFVRGSSLDARIPARGFDARRLLEIAIPLADAVSAAHAKGVTHRDLKPGNIMIDEDGRVRVLDFGLAKLRQPVKRSSDADASTELLTREGHVLGTIPYMSPEQVQGKEADERSDIFALGVILYELATGRRPFAGESSADLVSSILRDVPPPVEVDRDDLPHHLTRIVRRCLEKDPTHRYQVARDLCNDLEDLERELREGELEASASRIQLVSGPVAAAPARPARRRAPLLIAVGLAVAAAVWALAQWLGGPEAAAPPPAAAEAVRLAVLPAGSSNLEAGDGDLPVLIQALFSSELTGARNVRVLDPLGVSGLLARGGEGAAELDPGRRYQKLRAAEVDFVVESAVHASADGLQLLGRLVDSGSGEILYSASAAAAGRADLPAGVRELAGDLLGYIQVEVFQLARDDNLRPWVSVHEHDIEAVKAFIQATEYIYRYEPGGSRYLLRALEIDPDFVVARLWVVASLTGSGRLDEARMHYEVLRGLSDRASPVERAMIDLAGAMVAGDLAEQAHQLEFILGYSPGNHIVLLNLGDVQARMGDCRSALDTIRPVVEARWTYPPLWVLLGECLIDLGELEAARGELAEALTVGPMLPAVHAMLAGLHFLAGNADEETAHQRRWLEAAQVGPDRPATELASYYARLAAACLDGGQPERAAGLTRRALAYDPGHLESHDLLSRALLGLGDLAGARAAAVAALSVDGAWAPGHLTLARAAEREGQAEEAAGHYRRYLDLAPDAAETDEIERRLGALSGASDDGTPD